MAGRRVHFVLPPELLDRIDTQLPEGMSRGFWVRRALEKALGSQSAADVREAPGLAGKATSPAPSRASASPSLDRFR